MNLDPEFNLLSQKLLPEADLSNTNFNKASFINKISPYISRLLDNDFEKLVQIMYRIDVSEKEFALTLTPEGDKDVAKALSEMIYNRLLLKAEYRAKYNKDKNA